MSSASEDTAPNYVETPEIIGALRTFDYTVHPNTPLIRLVKEMEFWPELPGVLIRDENDYLGVLSRRKLFEGLSHPYGVELFYKRPISIFFDGLKLSFRPCPARMRVEEAVRFALSRPADEMYEPLAVFFDDGKIHLIDLNTLLLAQTQLLVNANKVVNQMYGISQILSTSLDLNTVLDAILENISAFIPSDRFAILYLRGEKLDLLAMRGFPPETDLRQASAAIEQNKAYETVLQNRETLYIPDIAQQEGWSYLPGLRRARSWLSIPLLQNAEALGVMTMVSHAPDAYSQEQITLIERFAKQAAIAIKNATLYKETIAFKHSLEQTIHQRTLALTQANQKLEVLDRTKMEFMKIVARELDEPIRQIRSHGRYIQKVATNGLDPQLSESVRNVTEEIARLSEVVEKLRDVAMIDTKEIVIEKKTVQLAAIFRKVREKFNRTCQEHGISFMLVDVDHLFDVLGDDQQLFKVFYHLVENAIRYTPKGGRISISGAQQIKIDSDQQYGEVHIAISDTGVGIDPRAQKEIFSKFYKGASGVIAPKDDTGGHTGLGLSIARGIINAHEGQIWVESPGRDLLTLPGSKFHVILPAKVPENPTSSPGRITRARI